MGVEGGELSNRHVHIHSLVVGQVHTQSTIAVASLLNDGIQRLQRDDVLGGILVLTKHQRITAN